MTPDEAFDAAMRAAACFTAHLDFSRLTVTKPAADPAVVSAEALAEALALMGVSQDEAVPTQLLALAI